MLQCGHEAPAGFGGSDDEREEGEQPGQAAAAAAAEEQPGQAAPAGGSGQGRSHKRSREEQDGTEAAPAGQAAAACEQERAPLAAAAAQPGAAQPGWRPQAALPRARKIAVGQQCKRLIDAARLRWLRRQGFDAALLKYVPSSVSGENRLLVAALPPTGTAGPGS